MLDVGWSELLIIGLVALIVVGPKELPGLMRTIGAFVAKAKEAAYSFQRQFQEAVDESELGKLKSDVEELQKDLSPEGVMGGLNPYGENFEEFDPDAWNKSIMEEEGKDQYRPPSARKANKTVDVIEDEAVTEGPQSGGDELGGESQAEESVKIKQGSEQR